MKKLYRKFKFKLVLLKSKILYTIRSPFDFYMSHCHLSGLVNTKNYKRSKKAYDYLSYKIMKNQRNLVSENLIEALNMKMKPIAQKLQDKRKYNGYNDRY